MDYSNLTGLEFAALRHLIGLSFADLEVEFGVREKTLRAWESGKYPVPADIGEKFRSLIDEHDSLVDQCLEEDGAVLLMREGSAYDVGRSRGWFVAAVARAINEYDGVEASWG